MRRVATDEAMEVGMPEMQPGTRGMQRVTPPATAEETLPGMIRAELNRQLMSTKKLLGLVVTLILLVGVGVWVYDSRQGVSNGESTSYRNFVASNNSFARGEDLRLHGQPQAAVDQYQQALEQVTNASEEAKVKLRLAISLRDVKDFTDAIALFKEIAANTEYPAISRAYAVQDLAVLVMANGGRGDLLAATFQNDPYKSLYVPNDLLLTYRHMAEYASSFYPTADSELLIAIWYADDIINAKKEKTHDQARISADLRIIAQKIASADRDLKRIQNEHENYFATIPYPLLQKAKIYGKLDLVAENHAEDPRVAFEKAIDSYAQYNGPAADGFARYYYASYLMNAYGVSARSQIVSVLKPLYADPRYSNKTIQSYLKNVSVEQTRKQLAVMANLDTDFKKHLISLGWTESDFK